MFSAMFLIFAVLLGIDVLFKQWVEEEMNPGETHELFGKKILIRKVYNRGLLLNLLEKRPAAVRKTAVAAGLGVLVWDVMLFMRKGRLTEKFGMALLSAGAASNIFDRLVRGKVIDYIGVKSKWSFLAKLTANLGDIYIVCGGLSVMLGNLFSRR